MTVHTNTTSCLCDLMSLDQHAEDNHNTNMGSKSFVRVEEFGYLGTTLTNQNSVHEYIKSRLQRGNSWYHSVQNLLSSSLVHKNMKIKTHKTKILPVVLYGCETLSLTLRGELKQRVSDNSVDQEGIYV